MGSFYGNIKHSNRVSLIFDKIYSNRKEMEKALLEGGDEIYHGRYVFINYGEQKFSPYIKVEITTDDLKVEEKEQYIPIQNITQDTFIPNKYYYIDNQTYKLAIEYKDNVEYYNQIKIKTPTNTFVVEKDFYIFNKESGKYKKATEYISDTDYYYFSLNAGEGDAYTTINENCEYEINRLIDEQAYGDCFHHTVWKKVWTQVGENSTAEEKYILVAYLDSQAPKFELITDAPKDIKGLVYQYDLVGSDLFDYQQLPYVVEIDDQNKSTLNAVLIALQNDIVGCNPSLYEGIYYTSFGQDNKYKLLPYNKLLNILKEDESRPAGQKNKYYKRSVLASAQGRLSEEGFLSIGDNLYLYGGDEFIEIEGITGISSFNKAFFDYPGSFYFKEKGSSNPPQEIYSSTLTISPNGKEEVISRYDPNHVYYYKSNVYLPQIRIQQVQEEITVESLVNLINKHENILIAKNPLQNNFESVDLKALDNYYFFHTYPYINSKNNYIKVNKTITKDNFIVGEYFIVNPDKPDGYELASEFDEKAEYYICEVIPGHFGDLQNNDISPAALIQMGIIREYKNIKNDSDFNLIRDYADNGEIFIYNKDGQYEIRTSFDPNLTEQTYYWFKSFNLNYFYYLSLYTPFADDGSEKRFLRKYSVNEGHPHFDPLRSTDLSYKFHVPRNWKFSNTTEFDFNESGFNKQKSFKIQNGVNEILLDEYASGELYPEHLEEVPEAAKYGTQGELLKTAQVDTKKFIIDLPEIGNAISDMWDIIYPVGYFRIVPIAEIDKLNPNKYYECIEGSANDITGKYQRLGLADKIEDNVTYYEFIAKNDSRYNIYLKENGINRDGWRYLFIGNDRDPNNTAAYPATVAEALRYIYNLIGLNTDNDYLSIPPSKTIYGLKNGLETLLGNFNDKFSENYILPIYQEEYISDQNYLKVGYGNAGTVQWTNNETLSEEAFNLINESTWGPLYKAQVVEYRLSETVTADNFNENIASFIAPNVKIQYYKKDGNSYIKADTYSEGLYEAEIVYEKATTYESNIVYYRNVNSLWSLLREFQDARENYQPDWNVDNPISPKHIQNRPKLIFSTLSAEDKIDDLNTEYSYWNIIESTPIIFDENSNPQEELEALITATTGFIEVNKDNNEITYELYRNNTDIADFIYIPTREYFKVIFEDHDSASIEDKWKSSVVVASGNLSIYDWDSNLTDVNLLRPATLEEVASMMNAVKEGTWEY